MNHLLNLTEKHQSLHAELKAMEERFLSLQEEAVQLQRRGEEVASRIAFLEELEPSLAPAPSVLNPEVDSDFSPQSVSTLSAAEAPFEA